MAGRRGGRSGGGRGAEESEKDVSNALLVRVLSELQKLKDSHAQLVQGRGAAAVAEKTVKQEEDAEEALNASATGYEHGSWCTDSKQGYGWSTRGVLQRPQYEKPVKVQYVCNTVRTWNKLRAYFDLICWLVIQNVSVATVDSTLRDNILKAWKQSGVDQGKLEIVLAKKVPRVKTPWDFTEEEKELQHNEKYSYSPPEPFSHKAAWNRFTSNLWLRYGKAWGERLSGMAGPVPSSSAPPAGPEGPSQESPSPPHLAAADAPRFTPQRSSTVLVQSAQTLEEGEEVSNDVSIVFLPYCKICPAEHVRIHITTHAITKKVEIWCDIQICVVNYYNVLSGI